jgi:hypothetical protein
MLFKLDENVPATLKEEFAAGGHGATTCQEESIAGAGDPLARNTPPRNNAS